MRGRLLVGTAIVAAGLAAGVAIGLVTRSDAASAQNAPAGARQHDNDAIDAAHGNARSPPPRGAGTTAARNAAPPLHGRTTGFGYQDGFRKGLNKSLDNSRRSAPHATRPRDARGEATPPVKHNDASLMRPRGGRDRRGDMTNDQSIWGRAMGQGRLRPEHDRRHRPAAPDAKARGHQDLTQNRTRRHPPDQAMGRATEFRGAQAARGSSVKARGSAAAGPSNLRKAQEALNQQGFDVGAPDGKLGKRTRSALIAFQKQRGLKTTGKVDHTTLQALLAGGGTAPAGPGAPAPTNPGQASPTAANPAQANPAPVSPPPAQAAPRSEPGATTGQGAAAPPTSPPPVSPQPIERETSPAPDTQMPDGGGTGRVPAGSPQNEDELPKDDQR